MSSTFWGQVFSAGSSQEVQIPADGVLTLTMLALSGKEGSKAQVFVETEGSQKVLLCTLKEGTIDQVQTDLEFTGTQATSFLVQGNASIHATGFLSLQMDDDEDLPFGDDSEEEEEEEVESPKKQKSVPPTKPTKQAPEKKQESKSKPEPTKPAEKRKNEEAKPVAAAKKQQKK